MSFIVRVLRFVFDSINIYLWDIIVNGLLMSYLFPIHIRQFILLLFGFKLKGVIHSGCVVQSNKLLIGKRSFINRNCIIDNAGAYLKVGDEVAIGYGCSFLTTNHDYKDPCRRGGQSFYKPIIVGNRVWIGANVIVLPGSVISDGCVVAAGSVVKGTLSNDYLYAGNPAIPIKKLD